MLRSDFFSPEQVEAIAGDYRNAGLEPAEVAAMAFAEKVTHHAYKVTREDIMNAAKKYLRKENRVVLYYLPKK